MKLTALKCTTTSLLNRTATTLLASAIWLGVAASAQAQSNDNAQPSEWWFDIEVIAFKHAIDGTQLAEHFDPTIVPINLNGSRDLIINHLFPNTQQLQRALATCYQRAEDKITLPPQTAPAFNIDNSLFQPLPPDPVVNINEILNSATDIQHSAVPTVALTPELGQAIEQEAEQQLANIQMAFSMPTPTEQTAAEMVEETADAPTAINTNNPTDNEFITLAQQQEPDQEPSTEQEQNLTSGTDSDDAADFTPAPLYPAMSLQSTLQSDRHQQGLLNLAVPENLGCRFSEEQTDPVQAHFEQWLSSELLAVNDIESKLSAQVAQDNLDALVSRLNDNNPGADQQETVQEIGQESTGNTSLERDYPAELPIRYDPAERKDTQSAYLLAKSELRLIRMAKAIHRRRGISNIMHIGWRQQVPFGREQANSVRIIAGKNYSEQFSYEGYPLLPTEQKSPLGLPSPQAPLTNNSINNSINNSSDDNALLAEIQAALSQLDNATSAPLLTADKPQNQHKVLQVPAVAPALTPEQVWELDGLFKVYLQYIGRVPYLHIDSQFNFRQPMLLENQRFPEALQSQLDALANNTNGENNENSAQTQYFLKPYHFQQLRRVVSQQIHYFDHPLFGLVVQIRRYRIPDNLR